MNTSIVHPAVVSGLFYPDDPTELQHMLKQLLENAKLHHVQPKALIVPHAGYIYSGSVAAQAYRTLSTRRHNIRHVILIGPAHYYLSKNIMSHTADAFTTPLGNIPLNRRLLDSLSQQGSITLEPAAFTQEHCLEVQLPFLQTLLDNFTITPLLIGQCQPERIATLLSQIWGDEQTLILISSDLSHFLTYDECAKLDNMTAEAVTHKQLEQIQAHQACGQLGIQALLLIAQQKQLQIQCLAMNNSGDTSGDKNRVVGYGAFSFTE